MRSTLRISTLALTLLAAPAFADGISYRTVALTGEQAPGTPDGVVFASFTTGLNHSIMTPRIDAAGRVAFIALVEGPDVDEINLGGIWSEDAGELGLVVRTGDPAPGTPDGVFFVGVPSNYLPFPPDFATGLAAFQGDVDGPGVDFSNDFGAWKDAAGGVELIAREGDPVPTELGDVVFATVFAPQIAETGAVLLKADVSGSPIHDGNNEALWSDRGGALAAVLREGDQAPGAPPGVLIGRGVFGTPSTFQESRFNDAERVAVAANLLGAGVHGGSDEALFLEGAGGLELLAREGDQAPGMDPGITYGGGSVLARFGFLSLNDAGRLAFQVRLGGAIPTTTVMFSNRSGAVMPEVVPGDPAPGTDFDFTLFGAPQLNDAGNLAFAAAVPDDDGDPFTTIWGVFWDQGGGLEPLILPGDPLPGGLVLDSASTLLGYNARGELAFRGSTRDAQDVSQPALLLADPTGDVHVLARRGELFDVAGDASDVREILRIEPGGLSESGQVAFRLDFTDGSSGHFTAALSGVPPFLAIGGACPGPVIIKVSVASPNGRIALLYSDSEGSAPVPGGPCAGTLLDLADPSLLTIKRADVSGNLLLQRNAPPGACGLLMQALDVDTCSTSNVAPVGGVE